ncbi:patatin-like phospholipase family protein [Lentzea sp. NPDC051838]|uniref:patatin-like phospholipase family protein n=1 Tax=Lentzea sp. NPDC051838 TaxID=3154849 RepID=UPI003440A32E
MRRALVLGCGGTVGGAWQVGALAAVRDALGWEPASADVIIGTSSGAHLAVLLGRGLTITDLIAAQRDSSDAPAFARRFFTRPPGRWPRLTDRDPAFLDGLTHDLVPGWVPHPATWLVAVSSRGARVAFGSPGAPRTSVAEALRASWAIPGWYQSVLIGRRRYFDGGVASPTSADLVPDVDEVVIVAPMVSEARVPGVGGRLELVLRQRMNRVAAREVASLRARGIRVVRVHPGAAELAAMGWNFMDPARRLPALEAALTHVPARLRSLA